MGDIVEAQHTSRCGLCDELIQPGDAIVVDITDTDGEWCHVTCVDDAEGDPTAVGGSF